MMNRTIGWLTQLGFEDKMAAICADIITAFGLLALAGFVYIVVRRFVMKGIIRLVKQTRTDWDDILLRKRFFQRASHLAPALFIYFMVPLAFGGHESAVDVAQCAARIYMLIAGLLMANSLLDTGVDVCRSRNLPYRSSVRGFAQAAKIALYIFVGVIIFSMIAGKSPAFFIGSMGAMTAVLVLIFRDSILGFVAGVQMSANKMVNIGDWIEMPKYGADGEVIDISLTTVKVRNWDQTIITIPTYAMISDSFKNWRGMAESGGRRIKRALYIDMTSIKFCTEEMLNKFSRFQDISGYIGAKRKELAEYNAEYQVDESEIVNGRRLTNIGTFRAYAIACLRNNPKIHQDMTLMVRQLAPTDHGLPIEIYAFSKDQVWVNYEGIQADIFDHILAVVPQFELRIFQNPTGEDFRKLQGK
ncbi:MAG: mechanosensitive ion channel [Deltaproteobacteria bacterium]|nr:mechanosensitive ion channel [Deltaproteobacteria bacterium]